VIRGIRVSVVFALVLAFMAVASPAHAVIVSGVVTNADRNDTARGGPGTDICRTDPGEARSGCES
jgi:hypothetical protein